MESKDALETLPWKANESLDKTERETLEQALQRDPELQKELGFLAALRESVKASQSETPGELGLARLKQELSSERQSVDFASRGWRNTAIAASLLVAVQAAVLINIYIDREDDTYTPLAGSVYEGSVLQIQFAPSATEVQIRTVLQESQAVLIDGPSALGIYRVRVPSAEVEAALPKLQSRPDVVEHVALE